MPNRNHLHYTIYFQQSYPSQRTSSYVIKICKVVAAIMMEIHVPKQQLTCLIMDHNLLLLNYRLVHSFLIGCKHGKMFPDENIQRHPGLQSCKVMISFWEARCGLHSLTLLCSRMLRTSFETVNTLQKGVRSLGGVERSP